MFQKLLVAVELGSAGEPVVRFARKLAVAGARVRLLHVLVNEAATFFADLLSAEDLVGQAQAGLHDLEKAFCKGDGDAVSVDAVTRQGTVDRCILNEALEFQSDAIVMGSHDWRGLNRLLLGSVAQRVLREADCPVCIVKGDIADNELRRVVLATGLDDTSRAAGDVFSTMLQATGARGDLIHVFRSDYWLAMGGAFVPGPAGSYPVTVTPEELQAHVGARRSDHEALLQAEAERLGTGARITPQLLDGDPWTVLADFAQREHVDLVIVGSHHYHGLQRLMLGSIAEKILRTLECPVLIVPQHVSDPIAEGP